MNTPKPSWLVYNYGPRCTLVSAASGLKFLGCHDDIDLIKILEDRLDFHPRFGPSALNYISLGGYPPKLDQAIETAGFKANLKVRAKTRFNTSFTSLTTNFINTKSVAILNCIVAPGGKFNHSVLAYELDINHRILATIDPNNGIITAYQWRNLNLIACITLISLA